MIRRVLGVLAALVAVVVVAVIAPLLIDAPRLDAAVQHTYVLVDAARPTPCKGVADRTLHVTVVVPDGAGPFPVMLVGPGSGASQRAVAVADAAAFAQRGYVGVAVPFPCTNAPGETTLDPDVALDVYRQPADVSFVLTQLLAKSATPNDELSGLLDPDRIGYTGTSSGGVTGLLFFNTCCTDDRIGAVVASKAFAIPTGPGLPADGEYDWSRSIPLYLWAACNDVVTPFGPAYDAFLAASPPKFFFQDATGTHASPVVFPDGTHEAFVDRYVAGDQSPALLDVLLAAADDPHFAFDVGRAGRRLAVPACGGAAREPGAGAAADGDAVIEVTPGFTG
jgi:hypothetical protein